MRLSREAALASRRSTRVASAGLALLTSLAAGAPRVLLLNSYHPGYEWSDDEMRGVREAVLGARPDAEIDTEFLDHRRHDDPSCADAFAALLRRKYGQSRLDVVITTDDAATEFFLARGATIAPGAPVVFCGVNYRDDYSRAVQLARQGGFPVTGVLETVALADTARLALRLHPGARRVFTVGEDLADRYDLQLARALPGIEVRRLSPHDSPLQEFGERLEALPPDSIVLLSAFSHDGANRQLSMAESIRFTAAHCRVPIYGFNKNALGYGIVGGKLNDGYFQGRAAGEMAVSILNGAPAASLPIQSDAGQPFQFEAAELKRWGINDQQLPAGSIVHGRRPSLYAQYRTAIMAGSAFLGAESVAIVLLLFQKSRRRRAEAALAASEQHLRGVLNSLFAFVGVMTTDGVLTEVNLAPLEAAGIRASDVVGKPLWECFWFSYSEKERERIRAAVVKAQSGESSRFDVEARMKDGLVPVDFMLTPMRDADGRITYLIPSGVPIAERKRAEETLRRSEERFRRLVETVPGMLFITDAAGHNIYTNRSFHEFTGLSEQELEGEGWIRILHPDDAERTRATWEGCVREGRFYEIEHRFRRSDGAWRWHLTRGMPLRSSDGPIERWLGIATDIHDRKHSEAALRRANEDLRQLIWAASHDLQEPARMVMTFTQLLSERCAGELRGQGLQFLEHARQGAQRMYDHLAALRAYWEVSDEGLAGAVERVDMTAALWDAWRSLGPLADAACAEMTHGELPVVTGERGALVRVLGHLLRNAVQYRDPERRLRIHVSAELQGSAWKFRIEDNGLGIAPEHREYIFGLFKRLHTRGDIVGSGMGLPLCRRIIERAGGRIGVESEPGRGSTFWFTLPKPTVEENNIFVGRAHSSH
jgi:PAS domain S-box-containing protein